MYDREKNTAYIYKIKESKKDLFINGNKLKDSGFIPFCALSEAKGMVTRMKVAGFNGRRRKLLYIISACIVFIMISMLSISCICPLFSLLERFTGLEISTGNNIDTSLITDELIYPGSVVMVQVSGEIERVLELVGDYGVALSKDELAALSQLPDKITKQDISVTAYSTADDRGKVLDYYDSLTRKGWTVNDFGDAGGNLQESNILLAEKKERRQALLMTETESNTFIIFIDFDWKVFENDEQ